MVSRALVSDPAEASLLSPRLMPAGGLVRRNSVGCSGGLNGRWGGWTSRTFGDASDRAGASFLQHGDVFACFNPGLLLA